MISSRRGLEMRIFIRHVPRLANVWNSSFVPSVHARLESAMERFGILAFLGHPFEVVVIDPMIESDVHAAVERWFSTNPALRSRNLVLDDQETTFIDAMKAALLRGGVIRS